MVIENVNQYQTINKFVSKFLSHHSTDMLTEWKQKKNLNKFKQLFEDDQDQHLKRPKSKYIYFCDEKRKELRKEYPDMDIRQITCELGKRWQTFKENPDRETDERLTRLFNLDRERYNTLKKQPEDKHKSIKSLYLYFCSTIRLKNPLVTMKELGILWGEAKNNETQYQKLCKEYESFQEKNKSE